MQGAHNFETEDSSIATIDRRTPESTNNPTIRNSTVYRTPMHCGACISRAGSQVGGVTATAYPVRPLGLLVAS
jgi:hypothetical protein